MRGVFSAQFGTAVDFRHGSIALHLQSSASEDTKPEECVQYGCRQCTIDEFSNGSSFGDFGNEHAHERWPSDPPTPVEDGPVIKPSLSLLVVRCISKLCKGICVKSELYYPLNVVTHALHVHVQDMPRLIRKQTYHHDEHSQTKADLAQTTDTNLQTGDNRYCSASSHSPNDNGLICCGELDVRVQSSESVIHLLAANSQTGTDTEHRAHHWEDIDGISHPTIDFVTDQGIETRSNSHWKTFSVTHEGKKKSNYYIHNPPVNTPVEQSQINSVLRSLIIAVPKSEKNGTR